MNSSFQQYLRENYTQPNSEETLVCFNNEIGLIYLGLTSEEAEDIGAGDEREVIKICDRVHAVRVKWGPAWSLEGRICINSPSLPLETSNGTYYPHLYRSQVSDSWLDELRSHACQYVRVHTIDVDEDEEEVISCQVIFSHNGGISSTLQGDNCAIVLPRCFRVTETDSKNFMLEKVGAASETGSINYYEIHQLLDNGKVIYPSLEYSGIYDLQIPEGYSLQVPEPSEQKGSCHPSDDEWIEEGGECTLESNPSDDEDDEFLLGGLDEPEELRSADNCESPKFKKSKECKDQRCAEELPKPITHYIDLGTKPSGLEISQCEEEIVKQEYPLHTDQLIHGTRILVLEGAPKLGKTTLAYYLFGNDDSQIDHISDPNLCEYRISPYVIIENATEIHADYINQVLNSDPGAKVIITTNVKLPKKQLGNLIAKVRFVEITKKLYHQPSVVEYEKCCFP